MARARKGAECGANDPVMAGIPKLTIFISSPGDVCEERTLVQRTIERLQSEYAGRVVLDPIFWEHEPLAATATFQDQIVRPGMADVTVSILWSRLGTRLPRNYTREDGSRYRVGTTAPVVPARGFPRSGNAAGDSYVRSEGPPWSSDWSAMASRNTSP